MDDNQLEFSADNAYAVIEKALDKTPYRVYRKQPNKRLFTCRARENDMSLNFYVSVDKEKQLARINLYFPFRFHRDKIIEACLAVNYLNGKNIRTLFIVEVSTGNIYFKRTESYFMGELSQEAVIDMVNTAVAISSHYKNQLLALARGSITITEFYEQ